MADTPKFLDEPANQKGRPFVVRVLEHGAYQLELSLFKQVRLTIHPQYLILNQQELEQLQHDIAQARGWELGFTGQAPREVSRF